MTNQSQAPGPVAPLSRWDITQSVQQCQRLPALSTTSVALRELLQGEHQFTQQISDVIRRDPSLTSRLLRLVNTVYYGLRNGVSSIDQAVLYLGIRQVRQLVIVTPVIEQFGSLTREPSFTWKQFWQHCIGTAMITHELCALVDGPEDDTPYIAGLLHDVGKIIMASLFPAHFQEVRHRLEAGETDLLAVECDVLGVDHAELGGLYLEHNHLPAPLIAAARFHHFSLNEAASPVVAAVKVADMLVRHAQIGRSGNPLHPTKAECLEADAWDVLLPNTCAAERTIIHNSMNHTLSRLPLVIDGLI